MMKYFQKCSRTITAQPGVEYIHWTAPSGLPITQAYYKVEFLQCRSRVTGTTKLKVLHESDKIDKNAHADGISPNVIHGLDAAHLTATVLAAKEAGLTAFAMIHDDYGTHAANTELLAKLIRERFVSQYNQPVFNRLADELEAQVADLDTRATLTELRPAMGNLDLNLVLQSPYFFI